MKRPDLFTRAWELHQAGDLRQAEAIYLRLLGEDPRDGRTWFVLANLYEAQGQPGEAIRCCRQAMDCCPHDSQGPVFLGNALLRQGNHAEAEAAYRLALQLNPDHALALVNLGFILGEQGRPAIALAAYRRALELQPELPEAHHNLANLLEAEGLHQEALGHFEEAIRQRPDYARAHVNCGGVLASLGRAAEAEASIRRALELQPDSPESHRSLGGALALQGKLDEAVAAYRHALRLNPDQAEAHWNLGLTLLTQGRYREGWPEFEWIWKVRNSWDLPHYDRPAWDGAPLQGRTILLHVEQGLGDTLFFIRYARLVQQRGGRTVVQCQPRLVRLLSRCAGIDLLLPQKAPLPPYDVHASLQSLPGLFGTDRDSIPAEVPYLGADPDLVVSWRRRLAKVRGLRVGICWQGDLRHLWDRHRSIALSQFEPLARVEGVQLISLQKGPGCEQLAALGGRFPVLSLGPDLDEAAGGFMDTAAVLQSLDLVITADSALAHLAGALARPVWVALAFAADWRWLHSRSDSPWYPTARLFRQPALGAWEEVFHHMAGELRALRQTAGLGL
jgi:tetratricopeptide (TPR) repeat protein